MRRLLPLAVLPPMLGCPGVFNPTLLDDVGDESSDSSESSESSSTDDTDTDDTDTVTDSTDTESESDSTDTGPACGAGEVEVGGGCMGLAMVLSGAANPSDLLLADLSGFGNLDLVVAEAGAVPRFYPGNGAGFDDFMPIPGAAARGLAVGALDADLPVDLATVGEDVALFQSLGGGLFMFLGTLAIADGWDIVLGDVDGDLDDDLVVSDPGAPAVLVFTADAGIYTTLAVLPAAGPQGVVLADVDGDLDLDVAVADGTASEVLVFHNFDGTFSETPTTVVAVPKVYDLAAADLDGDGRAELMAVGNNGNIVVIGVGLQAEVPVGVEPRRIALGDVDGDGNIDMVVANRMSDDASILLGDGRGEFAPEVRLSSRPETGMAESVALGDLDGDGRDEILIGGLSTGQVSVFAYVP